MDQHTKNQITENTRQHIAQVQNKIEEEISSLSGDITKNAEELRSFADDPEGAETAMIQEAFIEHGKSKLQELKKLYPSPYFTRCDLYFDDEQTEKSFYFAKFSFDKEAIFSWTTPVAALRFEEPGSVTYQTPEEGIRHGRLIRKDQYMIVNGKLIFLASESINLPRELIYQEYLSSRKSSFTLPEIVAQMEKAQDQVIRAHHTGPFVISGPAGSGKTTLALHRVAYLTQSPETSRLYPNRSIIVFVQDNGTKNYFSHLLPELGIHNIRITTFSQWALELLELSEAAYVTRWGATEKERDEYEYQKIAALKEATTLAPYRRGNPFGYLEKIYQAFLTPSQIHLFNQQKVQNLFDRYDLTILLQAAQRTWKGFWYTRMMSIRMKSGLMRQEAQRLPLIYPLMVVDEFQNYLPEQLTLFKSCLNQRHQSVLYVGDMAQQTQFGTIHDWKEINEVISSDRTVRLHKVYRNTKKILEYLEDLGFTVEIPDGLREGKAVVELDLNREEEITYIQNLAKEAEGGSIGVLCKDKDYLDNFKQTFKDNSQIYCMSIREAQGVEFEIVCLVGVSKEMFEVQSEEGNANHYLEERKRITKDLAYVALTRAISELHVLGQNNLKESLESCM